jgi:hypothetical protein
MAAQLLASRAVLSSTELVSYDYLGTEERECWHPSTELSVGRRMPMELFSFIPFVPIWQDLCIIKLYHIMAICAIWPWSSSVKKHIWNIFPKSPNFCLSPDMKSISELGGRKLYIPADSTQRHTLYTILHADFTYWFFSTPEYKCNEAWFKNPTLIQSLDICDNDIRRLNMAIKHKN